MRATRDARRPRVWPSASTTNHLRAISPLGKKVDIQNSPRFEKPLRRPLGQQGPSTHYEIARVRVVPPRRVGVRGPPGGQPQDSVKNKDYRIPEQLVNA